MLASSALALASLLAPILVAAQGVAGSASGNLSARTSYVAFFRPEPEGAPDVVFLLRGQPQWQSRPASDSGYMMARNSLSIFASDPTTFLDYRTATASGEFALGYQPSGRVLRMAGAEYPLEDANVIVIEHVDGVGGAPSIVRQLRLSLPAGERGGDFAARLRALPELGKFLR